MRLTRLLTTALSAFAVVVTLQATVLHATTLVQLDFDDVVATSELIFEGRVVSTEARSTGPRTIHTYVQFQIIDIIKGQYTGDTIELRYLGGEVDGRRLEVTELQVPTLGETGFYFVESIHTQQIHPLVGWSQGHYLIQRDASGEARVLTANRQPIADVTALSAPATTPQILGHDGTARGVQILQLTDPRARMSAEEFKQTVRDIVGNQQQQGVGR